METTLAEQTRDFARRFFTLIEELDPEDWMSANDALAQTLAAHPDHPYAVYIRDDRARRAGFSAAAESIREAEFPQIERRKAGIRGNAPVFYRTWRPGTGINLDLPHQVPSGHPLRTATEDHHPLRREPETEPRAPWRRRSNALRARSGEPAEDRRSRLAGWWHAVTRR